MEHIESISHETIRRVLKKRIETLEGGGWIITARQNSSLVANMEQVLDVCKRPMMKSFL